MFGLTLDNKEDRKLTLPDLLAAMVADGLIKMKNNAVRYSIVESFILLHDTLLYIFFEIF